MSFVEQAALRGKAALRSASFGCLASASTQRSLGPRLGAMLGLLAFALCAPAQAQGSKGSGRNWVAAWTASAQGPYPIGNPTAQPELKFALPSADRGATDQTFRLIVRPDVWGGEARIRLSNAFGNKPVTFDDVELALQSSGSALVPHTSRPVTFEGKASVTVPAGQSALSDMVALSWVKDRNDPLLSNRKLAVSFHVAGESGPITWHAKALTTSYISPPGSGSHGREESEISFPFSSTSWYFLDEVEMAVPDARTIVAFGDSITDGTASTLNEDDRWPDVFSRRIHAAFGNRFSIVNEGIGGNMVIGPSNYASQPFAGGPAALDRLDRDLLSLPHVTKVIFLEGINDFGNAGVEPEKVEAGIRAFVDKLRARIPAVKLYIGTLTSAVNSTNAGYGAPVVEEKRRAFNQFIRSAGIFDGVIDFDAATIDRNTGELKAEFQPNSTTGGPGDKLHPNRAGYAAMGQAIDFAKVFGAEP
ncbi:MAG: lysophospholipase [Hyphomicrobiales bacterium]|nr:lysophospholipase [Hyphomicrobiales bacterium]